MPGPGTSDLHASWRACWNMPPGMETRLCHPNFPHDRKHPRHGFGFAFAKQRFVRSEPLLAWLTSANTAHIKDSKGEMGARETMRALSTDMICKALSDELHIDGTMQQGPGSTFSGVRHSHVIINVVTNSSRDRRLEPIQHACSPWKLDMFNQFFDWFLTIIVRKTEE